MRRIIWAAAIIMALTTSAVAADPPPIPEAHQTRFDACTAHLDAFDFPKAESCFRKFHKDLRRSPLAPAALHDLALAQRFGGDLEAAIKTHKKLARDYKRSTLTPDALWFIATESAKLGHMDDAAIHYAAYARRVPGRRRTAQAWQRAITIWRAKRKTKIKAVDALNRYEAELARTRPKVVWRARYIRAELLADIGRFEESMKTLEVVEKDVAAQGDVGGLLSVHDLRIAVWKRQEKSRNVKRERAQMMKLWSKLKPEARAGLDAASVERVSAQALDALEPRFQAFLALKLPADPFKKIGASRSLVRKKIRAAIKLRVALAGVPTSAGADAAPIPSWQRARYMLGRLDDELSTDINALKLKDRRRAAYVSKLGLEPGGTLRDRALATYEEVLASVNTRGHHTAAVTSVLERLDRLVVKRRPISEIHPGMTYEHQALQQPKFIELGNNPTL